MNVIKAYQCLTFLLKSRLYQKMRAVIYAHWTIIWFPTFHHAITGSGIFRRLILVAIASSHIQILF